MRYLAIIFILFAVVLVATTACTKKEAPLPTDNTGNGGTGGNTGGSNPPANINNETNLVNDSNGVDIGNVI